MNRKHLKHLATAIIGLACLAAPAWADPEQLQLVVIFQPVQSNGTLDPNVGLPIFFNALLNTTTGKFIGTAKAGIGNASFKNQTYVDPGLFVGAFAVTPIVKHDLYLVRADGDAIYHVMGTVQ